MPPLQLGVREGVSEVVESFLELFCVARKELHLGVHVLELLLQRFEVLIRCAFLESRRGLQRLEQVVGFPVSHC